MYKSIIHSMLIAIAPLMWVNAAFCEALEDPTRPPAFAITPSDADQPKTTSWTLQSILIGPQRRVAVVNGATVTVGKHVDGARVTRIGPDGIDLVNDGEHLTLRLIQGISKVPANSKASR